MPPYRRHFAQAFILVAILVSGIFAAAYASTPTDSLKLAWDGKIFSSEEEFRRHVVSRGWKRFVKLHPAAIAILETDSPTLQWDGKIFSSKDEFRRHVVSRGWKRFVKLHPAAVAILEGRASMSGQPAGGSPPCHANNDKDKTCPETTTTGTTPTTGTTTTSPTTTESTTTTTGTTTTSPTTTESTTTSQTTTTTTTTTGTATTTSTPPPSRYFDSGSPYNVPIGNAAVHPKSAQWIGELYNGILGVNVNQSAWTPGIFYADASTPRKTVPIDEGWTLDDVPIPSNLAPSSDEDAYAIIIDTARGRAYEFFSLQKSSTSPSGWWARTANILRLDGSGVWNGDLGPWGALASSMGMLGGLILKSDVDAGVINHALFCGAPKNLIEGGWDGIPPATTSDGSGPAGSMPMGSRLQLDPSLDLSKIPLESGEAIIVRALQQYGCYVALSTGPAFLVFAQNYKFLPGETNPYPSSWGNGISKELVRYMRVVEGPPAPSYDDRTVFGQPHK